MDVLFILFTKGVKNYTGEIKENLSMRNRTGLFEARFLNSFEVY